MEIFKVSRGCSQTVQLNWQEFVFVKAENEEQAREIVESGAELIGGNRATLSWVEEPGSREQEPSSKYPDVQYDPENGGEYHVEVVNVFSGVAA